MLDSRSAGVEAGISARGECELVEGEEAAKIKHAIHSRYLTDEALADPQVGAVFESFDDFVIRFAPKKWISWDMGELDQQMFGGKMAANAYFKPLDV